jgi:hypothetical protein
MLSQYFLKFVDNLIILILEEKAVFIVVLLCLFFFDALVEIDHFHLLVGRRDCLHNLGSAGGQAARRPGGQAARRAGSRIVIVFTNI